ncbi:cell division protein FtsZ [Patescibacteria group bacterium]|jgi:cell division protein FtsZ|nr:cell division protein FtsZ [Patescibacteria group bacterium]
MRHVQPEIESFARIRVVGAGGSGNNAINHMINSGVQGVEFVAINTDAQDLHHSPAKKKIHIGKNLTRGLGAGGSHEVGRRAAEETREEILEALKGSDMVFIAGGMGGGTGTGANPVIAAIARELGALTVGVVTKPFGFEGQARSRTAEQGIEELKREVDALIVIPNDRLLAVVDRETSVSNAFAMCDDILRQAVEGISDLITTPGIINVDFADIRSVMENSGSALMGVGSASGENRAIEAAQKAINSPLLEVSINGAKGVLFAIAGGDDLGMLEVQDAAKTITDSIDPNARVIFGTIKDEKLKKNEIKVTVIATGFPDDQILPASSLFTVGSPDQNEAPTKHEPAQERPAPAEARRTEQPTQPTQPTQPPEQPGRIHNTFAGIRGIGGGERQERGKQDTQERREDATPPEQADTQEKPKDDDEWGVPAFLRRSKIK